MFHLKRVSADAGWLLHISCPRATHPDHVLISWEHVFLVHAVSCVVSYLAAWAGSSIENNNALKILWLWFALHWTAAGNNRMNITPRPPRQQPPPRPTTSWRRRCRYHPLLCRLMTNAISNVVEPANKDVVPSCYAFRLCFTSSNRQHWAATRATRSASTIAT